jgi:hypothetical protein
MARTYKEKLGTPQGVGQWKALETPADVKRFLRWCILSVRDQTLDTRTAATLGQLGCYLLNAMEAADFHRDLLAIKQRLDAHDESRTENGTGTH